jgi:predicted PurR-regulated permease PerM
VTVGSVVRVVVTTALVLAVLAALYIARGALLTIYISGLLAIGLGPVVRSIERAAGRGTQRVPRWLAILVIYVTIVGALTVAGLLIVPPLIDQAEDLWRRMPELLSRAQQFFVNRHLLDHPITLEEAVRNAPGPGQAVNTVAMAVGTVFGGILTLATVLILTFYLLVDSESLFEGFARLFPHADRPRIRSAALKISDKVSAWLRGQLMLGGLVGLSGALGLFLLGVPYFYVLGLIVAFGELIPIVGPVLSAVPGLLVALTVSNETALFTLIFFFVQQQVESQVLVPKVMGRQVGVSAVGVIVALLIGGELLGVVGAILAVPTAAIIQVVFQEVLEERDRTAPDRNLTVS